MDNINAYYDVNLKYARLNELGITRDHAENFLNKSTGVKYNDSFQFVRMNLEDRENLPSLFSDSKFDVVCNLAAQAGVRYSIENPETYIDSNVVGFLNVLECCRHNDIQHLLYASSSSVYGENEKVPFATTDNVDYPISLYAATKKSNELMAYTYSHLYNIPTTGLRFFTVYGPWGRPDMALFKFTKAILNDESIDVYNNGDMKRDFTYIDDLILAMVGLLGNIPASEACEISNSDSLSPVAPFRVVNIGNSNTISLSEFIKEIERNLGKIANKNLMPMQAGDVAATFADTRLLQDLTGVLPKTDISQGIKAFIDWYRLYYNC